MLWNKLDKEILAFIQEDIPLTNRPFKELAEKLAVTEEEVVTRIKQLKEQGIIRRFGAVLRHQKAGYNSNAMVAWLVDESEADKIGHLMAENKNVSHCYLREVPQEFKYNMFTMIHAKNYQQLTAIVEYISKQTGVDKYIILDSIQEFKKVSMKYI